MYMAPEILVEDLRISRASIFDLILADLWALVMVFFSLINPSLKCPYLVEVRSEGNIGCQDELKRFISSLLRRGKHPLPDEKYEVERATVWCALEEVYKGCVNFNRQSRLSLDKAATILSREEKDFDVIPLKISQATAVEQFDQKLATYLHEAGHEEALQVGSVLSNDGTNACAFLSVKIVDTILTEIGTEGDVFAKVAGTTEDTIWLLPEKINPFRDLSKMYDPVEAYDILLDKKIIKAFHDFSEELPFADGVFSVEGRHKLHSKLCELGRTGFAAIFTSNPFVLTIGCLNGKPYLIDTHPVTLRPGSGNSLIIVGKENSSEVWMSLCCWLWKRLYHGDVKSLAVVTPRAEFADSETQKEPVIPQDNARAHINKDNISFAADHHRLFSGSNKRALREDGKPEVTSIDFDESSGACETLTSRAVSNETGRKCPRRDFAYDEREKWPEFLSLHGG